MIGQPEAVYFSSRFLVHFCIPIDKRRLKRNLPGEKVSPFLTGGCMLEKKSLTIFMYLLGILLGRLVLLTRY